MHIFKDFKNFADARLNLFAPVTLLIGKNASGKTNTIEAVELLANLAHGRAIHEITDMGRGLGSGTFEIRGGLPACARAGTNRFSLGFSGGFTFFGAHEMFGYTITVDVRPEPRISGERLSIGDRTIFHSELQSNARGALLRAQYDNFARGGNKPLITLSTDHSLLSRYRVAIAEADVERAQRYHEARRLVTAISDYLRASFVFDPNPRAMRAYERIGQRVLLRDAANLSSVLHDLDTRDEKSKETLARLLDTIRQLPEEPFEKFGFAVTRQGDVLFGLHTPENSDLIDARVLSDGTLRSLAVLTALETVPEGSRVVIEEFDNGVHPTRVGVLSAALWECSKRRHLNVLVTTHNPATLDALTPEQLTAVVLCLFDPETKAAKLLPLTRIPDSDLLLERGHLGNLVTKKILERHLMPNFSASQKQIAEDWLKSLQ